MNIFPAGGRGGGDFCINSLDLKTIFFCPNGGWEVSGHHLYCRGLIPSRGGGEILKLKKILFSYNDGWEVSGHHFMW